MAARLSALLIKDARKARRAEPSKRWVQGTTWPVALSLRDTDERTWERTPLSPTEQRARGRLALQFGSREELTDPRFGYRRLFAEVLGPAVALRRDFPWARVSRYVASQLPGAALAAALLLALFGNVGRLGATLPGHGYHARQTLVLEVVLTGGLVSVILGTASQAQNVGSVGVLGVGGYIAFAGLWAAPVSGASMNPHGRSGVRSLVVVHVDTRRTCEGTDRVAANLVGDGGQEPSHGGLDRGAACRAGKARGGVLRGVSGCDAREGDPVRG
jgi:hypothetical protein